MSSSNKHGEDTHIRKSVRKTMKGITKFSGDEDELGERLQYFTQESETAEKDTKNTERVKTRNLIAQSMRKIRCLLRTSGDSKKPLLSLQAMRARRVNGLDGYITIYVHFTNNINDIFASAQAEGIDLNKLFIITEFEQGETMQTHGRYMWDSMTQLPKDVSQDNEARKLFMEKMNSDKQSILLKSLEDIEVDVVTGLDGYYAFYVSTEVSAQEFFELCLKKGINLEKVVLIREQKTTSGVMEAEGCYIWDESEKQPFEISDHGFLMEIFLKKLAPRNTPGG